MTTDRPSLRAEGVTRRFGGAKGTLAVDAVSIEVRPGETLALVGESGSGKTTLGRLLVGLEAPDAGAVTYGETALARMTRSDLVAFRREVQIVFQDPYASLNPRLTVRSTLAEVLSVHRIAHGFDAEDRIAGLLERVGLDPASADRYPHEFSGGQRQRIGVARALAVEPSIIIADEPVSALDVSVQAKILALLIDLQADLGLGYLFISHDLAVVRRVADRVAVMRAGRLVETGAADAVYDTPSDDYTQALLAAVPTLPTAT
ncbi:MAG: ATP-binding cassette domain-containing protein [Gemmatimonadota bacterium]|nr:ATP-binding cassette domain-containing protein [Gemmatimonadota bacterium]